MDPEQTFIRVQERFSEMLTPRIRATLEYFHLFLAVTLFCILVIMHANYVQQPGCSSQLSEIELSDVQLIQIKITSVAMWSENDLEYSEVNFLNKQTDSEPQVTNADETSGNSAFNFLKTDFEISESQPDGFSISKDTVAEDGVHKTSKDMPRNRFFVSPKESIKTAIVHLVRKWHRRLCFVWRLTKRILGGLWEIAGIHLDLDIPKWLKILHLDRVNSYAVQWLGQRSKLLEPTYLYTVEKGYFLLPEEARLRHNIRTINISISAWNPCFGNRWQQLLINKLVGYDTILMNSLLNSPGKGYLFNYQTKEFYNLTYAHKQPESSASFGDYLVTKCGVLMMSLFVFFTTTMSVSFTLRETQARMLKFTVQLQHHARHRLPTFQLIFVHVIESLVFVPIMIGILFFLFEFYDDQLLAFMVLILVWLCELFTLISVRTPLSMKFFPRFFLLYFLVFHIYFFSYTHGFSYLALSTTTAFMQHLILYFWNRFEVPALQRFVQSRRLHFQQHPDFHITSSTFLASTLHIRRLNNNRNQAQDNNSELASGPGGRTGGIINPQVPMNNNATTTGFSGIQEQTDNGQQDRLGNHPQTDHVQSETVANPGSMNSFSSLLLWILGGASSASSEGINSFLSIFRDIRDHGHVFTGSPRQDNSTVDATPND